MKTIHTLLFDEVKAFDFKPDDFNGMLSGPGDDTFAGVRTDFHFVHHASKESLLAELHQVELLLTWEFAAHWFSKAPNLKAIFTPAAGADWVCRDPTGKVNVHYGTFHGPLIAESLLGAILYLNRRIPELLANQKNKRWDRNSQAGTHSLTNQTVLLIGYGSIAKHCAKTLTALGARVLGYRRTEMKATDPETGAMCVSGEGLKQAMSEADHLVLLLPGGAETDGFMSQELLRLTKPGAYIYNFGRGNALCEKDLLPFIESGHIAGAVLDVVEQEPLPVTSRLWDEPKILVMPHSSCVYSQYKPLFLKEVMALISEYY